MTVIGLDDTDSRERGMCTTFLAAQLADRLQREGATVKRTLLVRLNPAVEHKTRGNAALAIHADVGAECALALASDVIGDAETADPNTNPGAVVAPRVPERVPKTVAEFAEQAVRDHLDIERARNHLDDESFPHTSCGNGRGLIGALAAVGAWRAFDEWTYECIAYRERERWGTERQVDEDSVFAAAKNAHPTVWDTVDHQEGTAVCVPRTPCPVLHGIRGDDPDTVERVSYAVESEPVASRHTFVTNQGTDAHLRPATVDQVRDGRAYRVDGVVIEAPTTGEGGHVYLAIAAPEAPDGGTTGTRATESRLRCVAFEPTKQFRDRVRALRVGDRVTVCGEVGDGTCKLEKFAVRDLVRTEATTPTCPECERTMESAGADQGYRCRDCDTTAPGPVERPVERDLEHGWYEVPPRARRHVARPLVRGGFDAPVHPER